jgi:membrane-associated PAP2 superfamily phosphatase
MSLSKAKTDVSHVSSESVRNHRNTSLFRLTHVVLPGVLLLAASLLAQFSHVDFLALDTLFDFDSRQWWYGESWWANSLIHEWGKNLIVLIFLVAFFIWLGSWIFKHSRLPRWRYQAGYVVLAIVFTTSLVGLGKKLSNVDCPRDLEHYNGNRPFVHIFSDKPNELPRGYCFPGGHSSGAFSLLVFYFLFYPRNRRLARLSLGLALVLGAVYAWGQWVRGAHFPSHDIWSAAIGWYVNLGLYVAYFRQRLNSEKAQVQNRENGQKNDRLLEKPEIHLTV